jgi:sialate O-acetylesterase
VGGAPAEAFIDRKTLEWHPLLVDILYNWKQNDMIQDWCRGRAAQNIKKSTNPLQRHPYEPAYLYETGIAPIASYPIKGAIWYQGESNAHNVELHETIFPTLVKSWRDTWNKEDMPFYFVQLSSIERPSWPHFRDSQRRLAKKIENCAFAVSSDKGDKWDVHPKNKKPVGERLARQALHNTYGKKHITPCGPTIEKAARKGNSVILTFSCAQGMKSSDGEPLRTFEVAGEKGIFHPAELVEIKGNTIKVRCCEVKIPHRVRYGWQPYTTANLVNDEGLPASTFEAKVNE